MTDSTYVDKLSVIASLRSRKLNERADWVDREMPALIDTAKHAALLQKLGIDLAAARSLAPAHDEVAADSSPE